MTKAAHVAFICEGDVEAPGNAFSGSAHNLLVHLRRRGHPVSTINTQLPMVRRGLAAAQTIARDRAHWRARFRYGDASARAKSRIAEQALARLPQPVDVVLQIGAMSEPPQRGRIPYALYCDWNFALSLKNRSNAHSAIHRMPLEEAKHINAREAEIAAGASAIFTFSERLRESFIDDYGVAPDRVTTVKAGPNIELSRLTATERKDRLGHVPTMLFIGKEFERKGGDVVIQAFARVRERIPNCRLVIAGPSELASIPEGVEFLGFLRKDVPEELERLLQAYREADVFCLPSRQDPFPTVVREALFFSLPCVTSDIWAMPEMVIEGVTGFMVPPDAPGMLADRLCRILQDPALAQSLGAAGRKWAEKHFTWTAVVEAMHAKIQEIAAGTPLA